MPVTDVSHLMGHVESRIQAIAVPAALRRYRRRTSD